MQLIRNILLPTLLALLPLQYAQANLIVNGSLTGPLTNGAVPTGWTVSSHSPDTNNEINAAGVGNIYNAPASSSPDGGTWVGIARSGTSFAESFGQLVTGFTVGLQYDLSWYAAHFGALGSYIGENSIEALIDGVSIGTGSLLSVGQNWIVESLSFTATSTSHRLDFRLALDTQAYMQIDGISLTTNQTGDMPEPATAVLLGLGLAGIAYRRKSRNKV